MPSTFVLNEKHKNIKSAKNSLLLNKRQTTFNAGVASSQPKFKGKILIFKKNNSKNIPPNLHNKIMNENYGTMYAVNENIKLNNNGLINSNCYEVINRSDYNKINFRKQNNKSLLARRPTTRSTARSTNRSSSRPSSSNRSSSRPTSRSTNRSSSRPTARSSTRSSSARSSTRSSSRPSSSTSSSSRPSSSTRSSSRSSTSKSYKASKKRGKKFSPVLNNIKEGSNERNLSSRNSSSRNSSSRNSSSRNSSENNTNILGAKPLNMKKKILNILSKNKFKNKNNYSYKNLVEEHKSLSLLQLSKLATKKIKVSSNYLPKSLYNKLNQYQNGNINDIQFKRQLLSYILDIPVNENCLSNNNISN